MVLKPVKRSNYAEPQAAGMDLRASVATIIEPGRVGKVKTDLTTK